VEQVLCISRVSISLPHLCTLQHCAAGLLLAALWAGDISPQQWAAALPAAMAPPQHGAQQHGSQQQMRAVSHLQPP